MKQDDTQEQKDDHSIDNVKDYGQVTLGEKGTNKRVHLLSVIGEIEGHELLPSSTKTTKYEHVLPQLAAIEEDQDIKGVLILINTVGGDVEAGLAIAELIASLSKPTVSLVLGGKSFHRSADCGQCRLFFYRREWYRGHPSGQNQWYGHRGQTVL